MPFDDACILYVDGGTTRTRAWAAVGDRVVASDSVAVGARDGAREDSPDLVVDSLRRLVARIGDRCRSQGEPEPTLGVAAGMITSAQGLLEVPHVEAPAGAMELARGVVEWAGTHLDLPLRLVPGIRSGPPEAAPGEIGTTDIMRGEEVLALGLVRTGRLHGRGRLLSLGSHWKALRIDPEGRVSGSVSTLGGELVAASGSHTILASSVPRDWPEELPASWVAAGAGRARRDGLPRALYCVRLLDQRTTSSPNERLAFLVGAVVAASEEVLLPPEGGGPVVLVGSAPVCRAWAGFVLGRGMEPLVLEDSERDEAFRSGCRAVLSARSA